MRAMNFTIGWVLVAATVAPIEAINTQQTATPTTASAEVTQCAQAQMVVDQLLAGALARLETSRQANTAADMRATVDSLQNTMRDVRAQLASCTAAQAAGNASMDHSKMPMGPTPAKPAAGGKPEAPGAKPAVSPAPMDHSKTPMGSAPAAKPATTAKPAAPAPTDHSKMPMATAPAAKPARGAQPAPSAPMDHSKMAMAATADTSTQATDPVCGLKVDPAVAPHASHEGKSYSFCSEQHRELFQKNPAKYLPKGK